ncbi:amidohydrolase family protein [Salinibacterium sp.]|uniref:amidohydrolase family protein n=1 Tax=Salinibacterium sp. TaxID=1915057 RepID=UPI00286D2384|nr:amidohydrolase family protein [Salinibacterium sp.]
MKIDTHHHLWDLSIRPQAWMTDDMKSRIEGPYDMQAWESVANPEGIHHSIAVQTVPLAIETPELLAVGQHSASLAGVVGWLDVKDPEFRDNLDTLMSLPGANKLVGIRELAEYHPDAEWLASPTMNDAAEALGVANLTLDLLVLPHQIPAAMSLAESHPDVRFVLDHLAKPSLAADALERWARYLGALARLDNVACKMSGYATFDLPGTPSYPKLKPAFDIVLDAFGPQRIMFGSDWPVAELGASYATVMQIAHEFAASLSAAEQNRFWSGTALEWYPNVVILGAL